MSTGREGAGESLRHRPRDSQLPLAFAADETPYRREDFIPSTANRAALAWIENWPAFWPGHGLILHGPPDSGKTHLAHLWAEMSGAVFIGPTDMAGLTKENTFCALVLEEADINAGNPEREEALFHLLNRVSSDGRFILLTARRAPVLWPVRLPDLRSRLLALPSTSITPPDDEALTLALSKLFADRQIRVPPEVTSYLVKRMERSYVAARQLVTQLDEAALSAGRPLTLPFVRQILGAGDAEHGTKDKAG